MVAEKCQEWQSIIFAAVIRGTGCFPNYAKAMLADAEAEGGFGLPSLRWTQVRAIMEVTALREWSGAQGEMLDELRAWAGQHRRRVDVKRAGLQGFWWTEWWSQYGKDVEAGEVVGVPQLLFLPERNENLNAPEEWRSLRHEVIVAQDGSCQFDHGVKSFGIGVWTPFPGLQKAWRVTHVRSIYEAEVCALEANMAGLPVGESYLMAVDNSKVIDGWDIWVMRQRVRKRDVAASAWKRIVETIRQKWGMARPFRLVHVYSHVQEKLTVPPVDTAAAAAKRERITKERSKRVEEEGSECAARLEYANSQADILAKHGLSSEALEVPEHLFGEPRYKIVANGKACLDWQDARYHWQAREREQRLRKARVKADKGVLHNIDVQLAVPTDFELRQRALSSDALGRDNWEVFLLQLAVGEATPERISTQWNLFRRTEEGAILNELGVWKRCVMCGERWSLSHAWKWCEQGCAMLASKESPACAWSAEVQKARGKDGLPEVLAVYLREVFSPHSCIAKRDDSLLEAALRGWWPKADDALAKSHREEMVAWYRRWMVFWKGHLAEVRGVLAKSYMELARKSAAEVEEEEKAKQAALASLREAREEGERKRKLETGRPPQKPSKKGPRQQSLPEGGRLESWARRSEGQEPLADGSPTLSWNRDLGLAWRPNTCCPDSILFAMAVAALAPPADGWVGRIGAEWAPWLRQVKNWQRSDAECSSKRDAFLAAHPKEHGSDRDFAAASEWLQAMCGKPVRRRVSFQCEKHGLQEWREQRTTIPAPRWELLQPGMLPQQPGSGAALAINAGLQRMTVSDGCPVMDVSAAVGEALCEADIYDLRTEVHVASPLVWMDWASTHPQKRSVLCPLIGDEAGPWTVRVYDSWWEVVAFLLFSEQQQHYRVRCKMEGMWWLFDDTKGCLEGALAQQEAREWVVTHCLLRKLPNGVHGQPMAERVPPLGEKTAPPSQEGKRKWADSSCGADETLGAVGAPSAQRVRAGQPETRQGSGCGSAETPGIRGLRAKRSPTRDRRFEPPAKCPL